jgi:hypothetical protein
VSLHVAVGSELANDLTNVPGFLLRKARNGPHNGNVIIIALSRALVQQSFGGISIADDVVVEASWETRFWQRDIAVSRS